MPEGQHLAELDASPHETGLISPPLWLFFRVWFLLSMQSFGGGPATLTLIRRAMVERYGWVSELEFSRYWALVQVAPGINLLALTILIGRRVGGAAGITAALLGLLLPSVALTVLITIYYARIRSSTLVQSALSGILPATVGLGLLTALGMARPLLAAARQEGLGSLILCLVLLIGGGLAVSFWHCPVVLVLLAAGGLGAVGAVMQKPKNGSQDGSKETKNIAVELEERTQTPL